MVEGRCMKCKAKREIESPKYEVNGIGRGIVRGSCKKCGTKIYAILGDKDQPPELRAKVEAWKKSHKKGAAEGGARKSKSRGSRKSSGSRKSRSKKSRKSRK